MEIKNFIKLFFNENLDTLYKKGLISDFDITYKNSDISKKHAARIIHSYLKNVANEKDAADWSCAENLIDLYSCKTCVMHIAQVYAKGIISSDKDNVFGLDTMLASDEIETIRQRVLSPSLRLTPKALSLPIIKSYNLEETEKLVNSGYILVDVREDTEKSTSLYIKNISLPLSKLELNPHALPKDKPIIFYCNYGYKATYAARLAIKYGYAKNNEIGKSFQ